MGILRTGRRYGFPVRSSCEGVRRDNFPGVHKSLGETYLFGSRRDVLIRALTQVDITEDQTSREQLQESFRGIANNKVISFTH